MQVFKELLSGVSLMLFVIAIALQAGLVEAEKGLQDLMSRGDRVMNDAFNCMDEHTKAELKAHLLDATPQIVVAAATSKCAHVKASYAAAMMAHDSPITTATAQQMADDWFKGLGELYVKHIDETLAKPQLAQIRTDYVLAKWRACVTDKASDWSRLTDDASSVAQAAVIACENFMPYVRSALEYGLRSKGLPASKSGDMANSLRPTMKDVAVSKVISERAKRLPKR